MGLGQRRCACLCDKAQPTAPRVSRGQNVPVRRQSVGVLLNSRISRMAVGVTLSRRSAVERRRPSMASTNSKSTPASASCSRMARRRSVRLRKLTTKVAMLCDAPSCTGRRTAAEAGLHELLAAGAWAAQPRNAYASSSRRATTACEQGPE
eukprot:1689917-Prymnesium_polylepis.1